MQVLQAVTDQRNRQLHLSRRFLVPYSHWYSARTRAAAHAACNHWKVGHGKTASDHTVMTVSLFTLWLVNALENILEARDQHLARVAHNCADQLDLNKCIMPASTSEASCSIARATEQLCWEGLL